MKYRLLQNVNPDGSDGEIIIFDTEKSVYIPVNPENNDYQVYLNWVAAGNVPPPVERLGEGA